MTTSDRAGTEERLREALLEVMLNEGILNATEGSYNLRVADLLAAAALAATPTQSGAEGPAELDADGDPIRPDPHSEDWYDGYAEGQRDCAAALRSGAEVAAAPGLSEAWATAEAALPEGDYDDESGHPSLVIETHLYVGPDHVEARAYLTPGYSDPVAVTGPTPTAALLALAARLTAKP